MLRRLILTPYWSQLHLDQNEKRLLEKSREADAVAKQQRAVEQPLENAAKELDKEGFFDPAEVVDARERTCAAIVRRRGQPAFRKRLLACYKRRCAITGCNAVAVLEASHIIPYMGPQTNHSSNGLLLRADIHTLFDLGLVAVDVDTMTLLVSSELNATRYEKYRERPIRVPDKPESRPSFDALQKHRLESGL